MLSKNNRWITTLVVFLISLIFNLSSVSYAVAAGLINGGVVSGVISGPGQTSIHTFEAKAGDRVYVHAVDSNNSVLSIGMNTYGPSGTGVRYGGGGGSSIAASDFKITETGIHEVRVSASGSGGDAGLFPFHYQIHFFQMPGNVEADGILVNDGVTIGELTPGDIDSYTFMANAGERIYLHLADDNPKIGLFARIFNPSGELISYDSGPFVATFRNLKLSETGKYTVVVSHRVPQIMHLSAGYRIFFAKFPGSNEGGLLNHGDVITDTVDPVGDLDTYTFNAQVGDNIHLQIADSNNTTSESWVIVRDPDGIRIGGMYSDRIDAKITKAGIYSVVVFDNSGNMVDCCYGTGNYTLTFSCTNSSGAPGCNNPGTVVNPQKSAANSCTTSVGNPIDFSLGFKYQIETDYISGLLAFTRYYRSDAAWYSNSLGQRWRHNYDRRVEISGNQAHVTNEDGLVYIFENDGNGNWTPIATDNDVTATLVSTSNGYLYTTPEDTHEIYDTNGKLVRIEIRGGESLDLAYDESNRLIQVSDESGRSLSFSYNGSDSQVSSVITPDGVFSYSYGLYGNLVKITKPDGMVRNYHYENTSFVNALTGITDEKGIRFATYGYDAQGRAISSEHADGVESHTIAYNADGSATTTNPLGKQTTYHFETILGVRKIVSVEGHQSANCAAANQAYTYDTRGFLKSKTDWLGNQTAYTRDDRGLITSMTEAAGSTAERTTTYNYDPVYRLPAVITEAGRVTNNDYDAHGRLIETTITDSGTGQNRTTSYAYHPNKIDVNGNTILGRLASIDWPRTDVSDITSFTYDANYNLSKITNTLGHETNFLAYDGSGRPTLISNSNGVNTSITYDSLGRLISTTQGTAAKTSYVYDERGLLKKVTLPNGAYVNYGYDNAGRLVEISNSNSKIVYTLDSAGNRISEVYKDGADQLKYQHSRVFDELSRLKQSIDANKHAVRYTYDVNSNITQVADGNLNNTSFAFDALNRLTGSIDALSGQTVSSINDLDQTIGITDPRNNTTHYSYNAFGDLVSETNPDRGTITYNVDAAGNILKRTDARGIITNYQYDALNRLIHISYPSDSSLDTAFVYDKPHECGISIGRLCAVTNINGTQSYAYNQYGQIISVTDKRGSLSFFTLYTYDKAGLLTKVSLPSGRVISYELDTNKQVSKVSSTVGGVAQILANAIAYMPFGNIKELTYGNGLFLANTYNTAYQLTERQIGNFMNESYSYDAAGNITVKGSTSYGYDALYRLLHENSTTGLYDYDYDAIGNRLSKNGSGLSRSYNYPVDNSKLSSIGGAAIHYDAAGNIIADTQRSYTIDAAGRVANVNVGGTIAGSYSYDANNLRIRKTTGGNTIHYVYGLNGLLYGEYDASGNLIREYVYLNNEPLAQINASETLIYLHTDHLGAPRVASDSSTAKVWEWKSDAFGNGIPAGITSVNIRFPGQYYDDESGLHYNWNRYYDPGTGRYITSDPIGLEGGVNTFGYVEQNPVNHVDSLGLLNFKKFNYILGRNFSSKNFQSLKLKVKDSMTNKLKKHATKFAIGVQGGYILPSETYDIAFGYAWSLAVDCAKGLGWGCAKGLGEATGKLGYEILKFWMDQTYSGTGCGQNGYWGWQNNVLDNNPMMEELALTLSPYNSIEEIKALAISILQKKSALLNSKESLYIHNGSMRTGTAYDIFNSSAY